MRRAKMAAQMVLVGMLSLTVKTVEARNTPAAGSSSLAAGAYPGACQAWTQVNEGAFGLPGALDPQGQPVMPPPPEPYRAQEGFELLVFKQQIYLGMEADNQLGARLWRSRSGVVSPWRQTDWEEVAADEHGNPFGSADRAQHDHVDSLAAFQGQLYVSVANRGRGEGGFRLYRSASGTPGTWEEALGAAGPGFGDPDNENFKDMQVYDGRLCGGTWNERTGAQVWCSQDGTSWQQKNRGGFAELGEDPRRVAVWSGHVFNGALYFGVQNQGPLTDDSRDDRAEIFRAEGMDAENPWALVFEGPPGSFRADLLGDLNGWLYAATASPAGVQVYRSPAGAPESWEIASRPGLNGNPYNLGTVVDGAVVYNGALYVSVTNNRSGLNVWRTRGAVSPGEATPAWERVSVSGLGDPGNLSAELAVFNGSLFAWTSNYQRGHQVWRTACPVCQTQKIPAPGRYWFDDLGLEIHFHSENLEALEACVYPHAPPPGLAADLPGLGYLTFRPQPAAATFNASLSAKLDTWPETNGEPGPAERLAFLHWNGLRWQACSTPESAGQARPGTLTCEGVASFGSPWTVLPEESIPPPDAPPGAGLALLGGGILFVLMVAARSLRKR